MNKKNIRLLPLLIVMFTACVKDKPKVDDTPTMQDGRRMYITNEGSLGNGNASLSVYNTEDGSIANDVFSLKNGQPLGDVFQSMLIVDDRLFLAVNNSDKIAVVNKNDFSLIGNITLRKPRYMQVINEEKMLVSSLYYPEINIVNPKTLQVLGKIDIDYPNSEGMTLLNDKVYACNWDTACTYVYEIDALTNDITARINIAGAAPQQVLVDKNKKLWVLAGNVYKQKVATLTQIDPITKTIIKGFTFPAQADIMKPCWNPGKDTLYFLGVNYNGGTDYNGVYRMPITATTLPSTLFISAQPLQYFWALTVDSATNQIYVGDPKGFVQKGNVGIYQPDGTKTKSFDVQLGPGYFYFDK